MRGYLDAPDTDRLPALLKLLALGEVAYEDLPRVMGGNDDSRDDAVARARAAGLVGFCIANNRRVYRLRSVHANT